MLILGRRIHGEARTRSHDGIEVGDLPDKILNLGGEGAIFCQRAGQLKGAANL